jgi:hypothetical protein
MPLHHNYVRWLADYLRGRTACCQYNGLKSPPRIIHSGIPQGSVIFCDIFNGFISDCPVIAEIHASYADDVNQLGSDADLDILDEKLNACVWTTEVWAKRKKLVIAPEKLKVILFTPDTKQSNGHPHVFMDGKLILLHKKPKSLGIWHDTFNCWNRNAVETQKKFAHRVQIMKAVGRSSWGFDKETLLLTFNALIKPALGFGAPIWAPNIKPTSGVRQSM